MVLPYSWDAVMINPKQTRWNYCQRLRSLAVKFLPLHRSEFEKILDHERFNNQGRRTKVILKPFLYASLSDKTRFSMFLSSSIICIFFSILSVFSCGRKQENKPQDVTRTCNTTVMVCYNFNCRQFLFGAFSPIWKKYCSKEQACGSHQL